MRPIGFEMMAFGPDAGTAYDRAVKEALEGGWSASIADSDGFVQVRLPQRISAAEFIALAHHVAATGADAEDGLQRPSPPGSTEDDGASDRYRHARRMWRLWRRLIPSEQRVVAKAAGRLDGGTCTCIGLGSRDSRRARARSGVGGRERAYLFFGTAPD